MSTVPMTAPGSLAEEGSADVEDSPNPLKRLIHQKLLHSNVVASNNILLDAAPSSTTAIKAMSTLEVPAQHHITTPTESYNRIIEFESARAVADEESDEERGDSIPMGEVKRRTCRPSIEMQISQDLKEGKEGIIETISGFILSEKTMFQPIKISKETFIRFKQKDINSDYLFY